MSASSLSPPHSRGSSSRSQRRSPPKSPRASHKPHAPPSHHPHVTSQLASELDSVLRLAQQDVADEQEGEKTHAAGASDHPNETDRTSRSRGRKRSPRRKKKTTNETTNTTTSSSTTLLTPDSSLRSGRSRSNSSAAENAAAAAAATAAQAAATNPINKQQQPFNPSLIKRSVALIAAPPVTSSDPSRWLFLDSPPAPLHFDPSQPFTILTIVTFPRRRHQFKANLSVTVKQLYQHVKLLSGVTEAFDLLYSYPSRILCTPDATLADLQFDGGVSLMQRLFSELPLPSAIGAHSKAEHAANSSTSHRREPTVTMKNSTSTDRLSASS